MPLLPRRPSGPPPQLSGGMGRDLGSLGLPVSDVNDAVVNSISEAALARFPGSGSGAETEALTRVSLLKRIENVTAEAFREIVFDSIGDANLREAIERVVFQSNMAGIKEGSDDFYALLRAKMRRMNSCAQCIETILADQGEASGFDSYERALIIGCSRISRAYAGYYEHWFRTVQDPHVVVALESRSASSSSDDPPHFLSPYTVVLYDADAAKFEVEPYALFFAGVLVPVLSAFDECIASLVKVDEGHPMTLYMKAYRVAMAETEADALESAWHKVDSLWMDVKTSIQVVHDIEDGYSDPLRAKQGPDFSVRFLDDKYADKNDTIKMIQGVLCDYYGSRGTKLAEDGLTALQATSAGIYYIPFKCGCSLVFSYSGQSIPNRLDVKIAKGVKIYFDVDETQARVKQVCTTVESLFADAKSSVLEKYKPDAVEQLVWHVAAHEVGHAIYGMRSIGEYVAKDTTTMLEEPRAELTAMHTLKLLRDRGIVSSEDLEKYLVHFALDAVRYFSKFDSQSLQPYIKFQIHAYNTYAKHGFLSVNSDGKIVIDGSSTMAVLSDFSELFEQILDLLDRPSAESGKGLEVILQDMGLPSDFTREVVLRCKNM